MKIMLLSVRVGRPARHPVPADPDEPDAEPEFFRSAIEKHPLSGPVVLRPIGLEGDQVEDRRSHGGPDQAIMAYSAEHYPRWRAEWGRDDVVIGGFGENLAIEGADESTVCVGDRWALGNAIIEVTKPRSPCNRLAMYQRKSDLIRLVRDTDRSGWYLRVLVEGIIEAGSSIDVVERQCPQMTVARAARAMRNRTSDPDEARALFACPSLAEDWRLRLAREGIRGR